MRAYSAQQLINDSVHDRLSFPGHHIVIDSMWRRIRECSEMTVGVGTTS